MKVVELTLGKLKHHSFSRVYNEFFSVYQKLFLEGELRKEDVRKILSIVILFTNQSEEIMQQLGYRMALAYGNKTLDFTPLYDIAINTGLMPVAALIKGINALPLNEGAWRNDSFFSNIVDSYTDNFRHKGIVLTEQQFQLNDFFDESSNETSTVVAPTSYGKSELIISGIRNAKFKSICVLVPSKSLLAQTRKRILNAKIDWVTRIVSHPEMYKANEKSSVYVLTQERLTRLLNQNSELQFEIVIVDEAHNLLSKDGRNVLLASVIRILEFRNPNTAFKFLTPFVKDTSNLTIKNSAYRSLEFKVNEYVKSEQIYLVDYRENNQSLEFYDHFIHEIVPLENKSSDYISYLVDSSANKNVVYLNRPKHIQELAMELAKNLPKVNSEFIELAIEEIGSNVDKKYLLLDCLKHGVLYHHGSMSDPVRNYVEHLYQTCNQIRYLVTNSTLLEGVNLPAEEMFLLSTSKGLANLTPSQFRNLIGRVNRFSEIFSDSSIGALKKLQPRIHIVASDKYSRPNANLHSFCEKVMRVNKKDEDNVENVLLEAAEITDKNEDELDLALTRLENLQPGITLGYICPLVSTTVGLKLLQNNISEIDVFLFEAEIEKVITLFSESNNPINDSQTLMALIYEAFVSFINPANSHGKNNLLRLGSIEAQTFYAMFLNWKIEQTALPVMIQRFIRYWETLPDDALVFVGSWGDEKRENDHRETFTYMGKKTISEKINLAVVRIKEEEDFFDHVIFRFVEILNELKLLDEDFYKKVKYGTTDSDIITMIKNGFSRGVSEMLMHDYSNFIRFLDDDNVLINPSIHRRLIQDKIGFLQRNEVSLNVVAL